jgi:hypothetical protein
MNMSSYPPLTQPEPKRPVWRSVLGNTLPMRSAFLLFAVVVILFGWLHFVLALGISSTGHQIQAMSQELARLQRDNAALEKSTAQASSPAVMESRALEAEYRSQPAVYVMLDRPLVNSRGARNGGDKAP